MDIDLLDEKLSKLQEELEFFKKKEIANIENIRKEMQLLENEVKKLKHVELPEPNGYETIEKNILKSNTFEKHKTNVKNAKNEIFSELRSFKNEKEKHDYSFLNKKFILSRIYEISNDVQQNFTALKVRGEYFYKSYITKLTKLKDKCVCHFTKYGNMQNKIQSMLELISTNALTDVAVLNKNRLFFEMEMTKTFQNFYHHLYKYMEDSIKE